MPERIAVILAGGKSARMGADKATVIFESERLIDRVVRRLRPQADRLLISGPTNYGLDIEHIPDAADAPAGPAGGVFSAARRLAPEHGFVTAPVDGPFAPPDLVARLAESGGCAVAADREGLHPTFAYWRIVDVCAVEAEFVAGKKSLMRLAKLTKAETVAWAHASHFANVNAPSDLALYAGSF